MKNKTSHTAGPWAWDRLGDDFWVLDIEGYYLAEIITEDSEGLCRPKDAKANARLIAAAPELLHAAKALRNALAKGDPQYSMNAEEGEALNALDYAIHKAEGKGA